MKTLLLVAAVCPLLCGIVSAQEYTISTFAGSGKAPYGTQTSGTAVTAAPIEPVDMAADAAGNIYIASSSNIGFTQAVQEISSGKVTTLATLSGTVGGITVDAKGAVYYSDQGNHIVCKIVNSACTVFAGTKGSAGTAGDNGPATSAKLNTPGPLAFDTSGNLYIGDGVIVRKVTASGTISTFAGGGTGYCYSVTGDGGPATSASICRVTGLLADGSGNVFISDGGSGRVREVSASGTITTFAGTGKYAARDTSDGVLATASDLSSPTGLAMDSQGNLYFADQTSGRIRMVSNGVITTIAGTGGSGSATSFGGFSGDGGPATNALLSEPSAVTIIGSKLYVADTDNYRIRLLTPSTGALPTILPGGVTPVGGSTPVIQPGQWVVIYGTNLGPSPAALWAGDFPTTLGGTSVMINGKAAYLDYAGPNQVNVQAPDDTATGQTVDVIVTTPAGSTSAAVTLAPIAPSFFLLDGTHVAAEILRSDGSGALYGGAIDIAGPAGTSLGYPTVPVKAGDTIVLWAGGLGPVSPAVHAGKAFSGSSTPTSYATLTIGGQQVYPSYVGEVSAGLYQINLTVPSGLGVGDLPIVISASDYQYSSTPGTSGKGPMITLNDPVPPRGAVQSLTLSSSTGSSLSYITATVNLNGYPQPSPETVTLFADNPLLQIPASLSLTAPFATFGFAPPLVNSPTVVTITASAVGTSASTKFTILPPAVSCSTLAGMWNASESGTVNLALAAAGQVETDSGGIYGNGTVAIQQNGCNFQYPPVGIQSLTGTTLTSDQIAQATRTGVVNGTNVTVSGILGFLSVIEAGELAVNPGLTLSNVNTTANSMNGTGTVMGNSMTINETGQFIATGNFSFEGQNGAFTYTVTTTSTAQFNWAQSGQRPDARPALPSSFKPHIRTSTGGQAVRDALRDYFDKALIFAR